METSKEERPVAKTLQNRNIFIMETSKEDGPTAAKRSRTGNVDPQILENLKPLEPQNGKQIIQEKQQIIENLDDLQSSKLKLQAEIAEREDQLQAEIAKIAENEERLNELAGPLLETMKP